MKLLYPLVPTQGRDHIRVMVVYRRSAHSWPSRLSLFGDVLESDGPSHAVHEPLYYLDLIESPPRRVMMACNTADSADERRSLSRAKELIRTGQIDLVVLTDLGRLSRSLGDALDFLRHCVHHGTRVISFQDRVDTADADWEAIIVEAYSDMPTPDNAAEAGDPRE